ncbi:MAG: ribosome maturation factor RimM [Bacteroidaceae bacterium]
MIKANEVFKIGKMGRAHGIKGEICLHFTDDVFDRVDADYLVCDIDGILTPFFMEEWQFKGRDTAIIKFENINTEEDTKILQNADVYFPLSLAEERENEIQSWKVLTGFSVADTTHGHIGTVVLVDDSSANTLLEIKTPDSKNILLPIHPDLVESFDIKQRTITLNLPEGLLILN